MTSLQKSVCLILGLIILAGCSQYSPQAVDTTTATVPAASKIATIIPVAATVTRTDIPTATLFPLAFNKTPVGPCNERHPDDSDYYAVVTAAFGLAKDYEPKDLVMLGNYLPGIVVLPELLLRRKAAQQLKMLIEAMRQEGLQPTILSAYRSYYSQEVTHNRWEAEDPQNAFQISALPGHSEHQLGTVVDFSTPNLSTVTGDPALRFSPLFAETNEGIWLSEHAHEYGFTLTNPSGAEAWTGLVYEPWHYRYVGIELASYLKESGHFFTEYALMVNPEMPCLPE